MRSRLHGVRVWGMELLFFVLNLEGYKLPTLPMGHFGTAIFKLVCVLHSITYKTYLILAGNSSIHVLPRE